MKKPFAWSYSRYSCFKECPAKYKYNYIDKLPTTKNKYAQRGIDIHLLAEKYLDGRIKTLPKELIKLKDQMQHLKKIKAVPEQSWALTEKWGITDWKQGYLRMKIDAHYMGYDEQKNPRLLIIDFKTGQPRPTYEDQGHLYSTAALQLYPRLHAVSVEFWYIDHGLILPRSPMTFKHTRAEGMRNEWEKRIAPVREEKKFKPKPGAACKWCDFSKSKNGPCKYNSQGK